MIESEAIDVRAGDVHITPEQIGDVNIGTYGSGDYVLNTGNKVKAELITNNTVRIFDGVMVYGGLRDAVPINKYYNLTIDNGAQGKNRNDIIVRRYTKDDDSQKKARSTFAVVKGTPATGTASDPAIVSTDIRSGALTHDMQLHRVRIEGLNIVAVEPLFDVLMPMSEQQNMLAELNRKKILYDTAITADGTYTLTDSVENYSKIYVVISLYDNGRQPFTNIIPEELYGIASKIGIPPFSNASYFLDTNILLSGNTAKITSFQKGSAVSGARILKIIGSN